MLQRRRVPFVALVLALAAFMASSTVAPAWAASAKDKKQRQQQIGNQLDNLRNQVDELSGEEATLLDQVDASKARVAELDNRVHDLDAEVSAAEAALADAQQRLDTAEEQLRTAHQRADDLQRQLAAARDELRRRAVATYVEQEDTSLANFFTGVKTLGQMDAALGYASTVLAAQRSAIDRYDRLHDDADRAREAVAAAREDAAHRRDDVAQQTAAARSARADLVGARQQAASEAAHQDALLAEVQSKKADYEAEITDLQAESDQIAAFLQALPPSAGGGIVVSGKGVFSIPTPGAPIVSTFGPRVHPIYHTVRVHTGVDFGATAGTPIRAAADGTVVKAGWYGGYGNATIVDHGNGVATLYGHQSSIAVTEGQHVSRGQVIGFVGSTGLSTGPHLHFEVRIGGTPVDPLPYL